jgi:prepilin-type N-terminal cleavage/methylation domain-containing protein
VTICDSRQSAAKRVTFSLVQTGVRTSRGANGFTLPELLVVILIIALLAALLCPPLLRAKHRARLATCMSSLRQINIGVQTYSDDSSGAAPTLGAAAAATNIATLYSGYKKLRKQYIGLNGASSPQDKLFACPADTIYPNYVLKGAPAPWHYIRASLHDTNILDFSSYVFNGGDNVVRMVGSIATTRPGLTGVKLSAVKRPARTLLVTEASALAPWSWHAPSSAVVFEDARSVVSFVDGHESYIRIYWNNTPLPNGGLTFALGYDPPDGYDYQWSAN